VRDLGTLPGDTESSGLGINDEGEVVGVSWTHAHSGSRFLGHAFVWADGHMHDLDVLRRVPGALSALPPAEARGRTRLDALASSC